MHRSTFISQLPSLYSPLAVIAIAVPDLEDLIALIGAVASSALAFIFPSLLELLAFWPERRQRHFCWIFPWQVWIVKDFLILLLGVVGLLFGTYASIDSIILNIGKPDQSCALSLYRH
jgi:proton-coupled amino acid transporter